MTEEISKLRNQLAEISGKIQPLIEQQQRLSATLRDLESKQFILTNQIKRGDVELSTGRKEWFGTIWDFAEHLKTMKDVKRWTEWNTRLYHTLDVINGRMPETPGLLEHVND